MKKLILLLFIPFVSFSQTYKDVMSIKSEDMFKKVVIENGYEYNSTDNDWITYGFNIVKDSIKGNKSSKWMSYNSKDDRFILKLSRRSSIDELIGLETNHSENPYDLIVKNIKQKCKYYKIINYKGTDYVTYGCSESSYKGKIGFVISEGQGLIRHFPKE
jgi:hypothetical protein